MGDHRLSVEIQVTGFDGNVEKIDWWVNWDESQPSKVFDAMVEMANKAGLQVNPFYEDDYNE